MSILISGLLTLSLLMMCTGHSLLNKSHVQDIEHLKEHLQGVVDLDRMSEEQVKFYYFKVHDVESDDKLDGCELVQALLHFHAEASSPSGLDAGIVTDAELSLLIDPVLRTDDKNLDGFIDYAEFVSGQISQGL